MLYGALQDSAETERISESFLKGIIRQLEEHMTNHMQDVTHIRRPSLLTLLRATMRCKNRLNPLACKLVAAATASILDVQPRWGDGPIDDPNFIWKGVNLPSSENAVLYYCESLMILSTLCMGDNKADAASELGAMRVVPFKVLVLQILAPAVSEVSSSSPVSPKASYTPSKGDDSNDDDFLANAFVRYDLDESGAPGPAHSIA